MMKPQTAVKGVVIWGAGAGWGQPSVSPFVVKTLTWLRMAEIPYELQVLDRPPRSRSGKVPYLELDSGEYIEGSDQIIRYVSERHGVALDTDLSPTELACSHAMRRLLEESFYFLFAWERWLTPEGLAALKPVYFPAMPGLLRAFVASMLRRTMRRNLHGQGCGRLSAAEVQARGEEDIRALATLLGDRDYFFRSPSSIDAVAYSFLSAAINVPYPSALRTAITGSDTLPRYIERMRARYWGDGAPP